MAFRVPDAYAASPSAQPAQPSVDAPALSASESSTPVCVPVLCAYAAVWSLERPARASVAGLAHGASELSTLVVAPVLDAYDDAFSVQWRSSSSDRRH